MISKSLFSVVSPAGGRARLSVLIFHRVFPHADPLFPGEVDARCFDRMLGWLKNWFHILPLDEAVSRLEAGTLPARAAAITFDDGYADNYQVALPLLLKHRLSATFFVATGFLDGGRMWNDEIIEVVRRVSSRELDVDSLGFGRYGLEAPGARRVAIDSLLDKIKYLDAGERQEVVGRIVALAGVSLPANLMMTSTEVRGLRKAGMLVGAHTMNHPILARISAEQARFEIAGGKARLESILGEPVSLFAYPNGKPDVDYRAEHVSMVREAGFSLAMSTAWGVAGKKHDIFQLPRFTPWDRSPVRFGLRMAQNLLRANHAVANSTESAAAK